MDPSYLTDLCDPSNSVLVMVDLQGKIFEMAFNHQQLKRRAAQVLRLADLFQVPLVVTEQYPRGLGHTDPDLMQIYDELTTARQLLEKTSFGCCGDSGFTRALGEVLGGVRRGRGPGDPGRPVDVVVMGIETHVCVQQTVLELLRRDHRVVVLADCTGGRVEYNHQLALERFRQSGAILTSFESLAFEWTRTKDHACFKQMSGLIKEG